MIFVRLREAMDEYQERTGEKMTYERLAAMTGLARSTLESIATRKSYNPSLQTIDRICTALGCPPADLLVFEESSPGNKRGAS